MPKFLIVLQSLSDKTDGSGYPIPEEVGLEVRADTYVVSADSYDFWVGTERNLVASFPRKLVTFITAKSASKFSFEKGA